MTTHAEMFFTARQVEIISDAASEFGFFSGNHPRDKEVARQERKTFEGWLTDPEQYFDGMFVSSNRFNGVRLSIVLSEDRATVESVSFSREISRYGNPSHYTEAQISTMNARIAASL